MMSNLKTMFPTNNDESNKRGSCSNCTILSAAGYCLDLRFPKSLYPSEKKAISAPAFMNSIKMEANNRIVNTIITSKIHKMKGMKSVATSPGIW